MTGPNNVIDLNNLSQAKAELWWHNQKNDSGFVSHSTKKQEREKIQTRETIEKFNQQLEKMDDKFIPTLVATRRVEEGTQMTDVYALSPRQLQLRGEDISIKQFLSRASKLDLIPLEGKHALPRHVSEKTKIDFVKY